MNRNFIIGNLIKNLQKLPNVGYRSAKKMALQMLLDKENLLMPLARSMAEAGEKIRRCEICGNLTSDGICEICADPKRNRKIICVVESVADLWAIENTGIFNGVYHILNGTLSAVDGRGVEVLKLDDLVKRIEQNGVEEVVIATNATIDGQTTAFYIVNAIERMNLKITQPALGLPMGSELNFLDENTLNIAFKNKKEF
ncbi:MAG: recombination mediator RecR [Rickettsiales bacterium]|jgi:recombination protein RecR|nr:recombination mediator RecR [Rickettsiales bacterium]